MFEVAIDWASKKYEQILNDITTLAEKGKDLNFSVQFKDSQELTNYVNMLKDLGSGKQLQPLIDKIERLQNRIMAMGDKGKYMDFLQTEANAATRALDQYEKRFEAIRNAPFTQNKRYWDDERKGREATINKIKQSDEYIMAVERQARAQDQLRIAQERYAADEQKSAAAIQERKSKMDSLSESVSQLNSRLGEGKINLNIGGEFKTWALEVQNLVAQVKELVEQFQKLNQVQGNGGVLIQQTEAQTQAIIKESEAYKQLAQMREQAERFHSNFGKTGLDILNWHADSYIKSPSTMYNGYGNAYTDFDVIKNHVYALKEETILLKERQALMDKYSSVSDVGQKQRYNQILSVYNEVYDAMQRLKQEESKPSPHGGVLDPQKFTALQTAIDNIVKEINRLQDSFENLGKNNSLNNLSTYIDGLAITLGNLSNAIKLQPIDDSVKALIERVETAEKKLKEIGDAARYMNVRNGDRTQDKAADIQKLADGQAKVNAETQKGADAVDTLAYKYSRLVAQIENTQANLSKLLANGGHSSYYDSQIRSAIDAFQGVKDSLFKADMNNQSFQNLSAQFGFWSKAYQNVVKDANDFNKAEEKATNDRLKAEEKAGAARVKAREQQERQYEQVWQKGLAEREKAAAKAAKAEAKSASDAIVEYARLEGVLRRLNQLKTDATAAKVSTAEINGLIQRVKTLRDLYSEISLGQGKSASGLMFNDVKANANSRSTMLEIGAVFTETNRQIRENNQLNKEVEREAKKKADELAKAEKDIQDEIRKTKVLYDELQASIDRGKSAKRDMTVLTDQQSKLQGQMNLLSNMTQADKENTALVQKRIQNIKDLQSETKSLKKSEDELTKARERANKKSDDAAIKKLKDEEASVKTAWKQYDNLELKIKELESLRQRGIDANIDVSKVDAAIQRYTALSHIMRDMAINGGRVPLGTSIIGNNIGGFTAKDLMDSRLYNWNTKYSESALKEYKTSLAEIESRMKSAGRTAGNLGNYIDKLEAKKVDFRGLDTTRLDAAIQRIRDIKQELERFASTGQSIHGNNAREIISSMGLEAAKKEVSNATAELTKKQGYAAKAVNQLTTEEQKLAQTLGHSSSEMKNQSQVLSDLKTMATQYLSLWGAQSFLNNIIQIGGQLEQQRLSIGAILGDMAAGQHLFDQIKNLALVSPFGVMELDKDTKQLAAYGFKQSELFDMTKRLADISAGAGTEVSRLALALGHVRSEGALSGYTLRQFAMNNIPMLAKLSERLTEIEGKIVSTSEIRKRISKKEIGYEDVIAVIKDLTNEGGMFFNMQETMAEAVNAKFKNLKDSLDIMYSEIAESRVGDALKYIAETLMVLSRNWESTGRFLGYSALAWVAYKTAVMGANNGLVQYGVEEARTTMILNAKKIALNLSSASVKRLTADEIDQMVALKLLTKEQLLNAVASKKLTVDQAELAAATFGVSRAQLVSAASMGRTGVIMSGLGMRAHSLILSIRGIGVALKSAFLNPVGIAMIGLTSLFEWYMRWKQHNNEIKESITKMEQKSTEGYRNLSETVSKFSRVGKMDETGYVSAINDIIDALKNYAPDVNNILKEAYSIDDLGKRYEYLRGQLEETKDAYANLEKVASTAVYAAEESDLSDKIKDYIETLRKTEKAEFDFYQNRSAIEKALNSLGAYPGFSKARKNSDGSFKTIGEQIDLVRGNKGWSTFFSSALYTESQKAARAWNVFTGKLSDTETILKEKIDPAITEFADRINNNFAEKFGDKWKENGANVKTAWMEVVAEIDKIPGMTANVKNELLDKIFNNRWHLNIDFSTGEVSETLVGWRKEMQDYFDENNISLKVSVNDKIEDIEKRLKSIKDDAQSQVDRYGKILIGIGFKLDNLPSELPSVLNTPWNQNALDNYPTAKATLDSAKTAAKKFNLNLEGKNKSNKDKGRSEDKEAKKLREIAKLYKDAYDWYKKYAVQLGEGAGLTKVREQFQPLFDEFNKEWKTNLSLDSIPKYKENLDGLLETARGLYQTKAHRNNYMVDAIKQIRDAISDVDYTEAQRKMDEYASKVQTELDSLTRAWDIFNNVREATGNVELAVQISGADYQAGQTRNLAYAIKEKIEDDFATSGVTAIPFNITFDDKDIEKKIMEAFNADAPQKREGESDKAYSVRLSQYQERIKGIVEEYKKWRDLQRDVLKNDLNVFGKILGSAQNYETKLAKIRAELQEQVDAINALEKPEDMSDEDFESRRGYATDIATIQAIEKAWKETDNYALLFNNALLMTEDELNQGIITATEILNEKMRLNLISAKEYADEMAKIRKIQKDMDNKGMFGKDNSFTNFATGGLKALSDYYSRQMEKYDRIWNDKNSSRKEKEEAGERYNHYSKAQEKVENFQKSLGGADIILQMVTGTFEGMQQAAQSLSEMFDALGHEGSANTWSDIADTIGAIGASFNGVSNVMSNLMSGNIGGIISSAITAPIQTITAPMTAFAQIHDKKRERQIENLRFDVQKIDNTLNLIKSLRERSLGYDKGDLRRQLASMYSGDTTDYGKGMYEYYSRGGMDGTGYEQELQSLKKQREDYQKMYDLENDKKKKSKDSLEEYKAKLAELDITIINYSKDLADELFGIDLKGWADEIGDALMTAFENGEDAAKAFNKSVQGIMQQVLRKMLSLGIIQPMMERLQKKLFGEDGVGGSFDATNPEGTIDAAMKDVATFFGENGEGQKMIEATKTFYDRWEQFMKSQGLSLENDSSSSSSASSIKSVSESSFDLHLSYMNAIRADVSVMRNMQAQYYPLYYAAITAGNQILRNIENHTSAIMHSNDSIERSNQAILDRIDGLRNGAWKIPMK